MRIRNYYFLLATACCLFSCSNDKKKNHGPIVLGDSSTIVTETDPRKLEDLVTDLQPVITPSADRDTAKTESTKPTDTNTVKPVATEPAPQPAQTNLPASAGLKAEFKEVSILIPSLMAKISGSSNLTNANGAVYTWQSGKINGNTLRTTGGVSKVSQRYQSIIILENKNGNLPLDNLTTTTSWEAVKGNNGNYPITNLSANDLEYPGANNTALRNAVLRAGQRRHLSRKRIQELINSISHTRSANQAPLEVTLRSVMWKIDGKDVNGKIFSKQIRIDVPM